VLCGEKVYIGGGYELDLTESTMIDVYTPANNSWSASPINTSFTFFAMTTLNSQLIIAGGEDKSNKVTDKIFVLSGDQLKQCTKMTIPRSFASAAGHHGILIIAGGVNNHKTLATTEVFDSTTGQWYVTNDLPSPLRGLQSVIVNNTLYLLGGYSDNGDSTAVFSAVLDTLPSYQLEWSCQQDTPYSTSAPFRMQGRHLLTVGGLKPECDFLFSNHIYIFNNISHSWQIIGQTPLEINETAAFSVANSKIVVVGGQSYHERASNVVWIGTCKPQ